MQAWSRGQAPRANAVPSAAVLRLPVTFPLRFNRLNDQQSNYKLMFLSSTRWVSLRMELMANLVTLAVTLFVALGSSSASHSYQALTISLVLQVRAGLGRRARCGERQGA